MPALIRENDATCHTWRFYLVDPWARFGLWYTLAKEIIRGVIGTEGVVRNVDQGIQAIRLAEVGGMNTSDGVMYTGGENEDLPYEDDEKMAALGYQQVVDESDGVQEGAEEKEV